MVRRCLPALSSHDGVLTVDNVTSYVDGDGELRNVSELLQGARSGGGSRPKLGGVSALWGGGSVFPHCRALQERQHGAGGAAVGHAHL